MSGIKASIIIRCKDEERAISRVLEGVFSQRAGFGFEVILIDSGSTDGTLRVASAYDCRVVEIPPEEFGYGYTMNLGARAADGEILVYVSAHCPPVGSDWLARLAAPFSDPKVAGTFGGQTPEKGVNPFEEWRLARAFPENGGPEQEHMFSSANGAVRRSVWEQRPFDEELPFSEDRDWVKAVSGMGYVVRYLPEARVYHSHPFSLDGVYRRAYSAGWAKKAIYGPDCRFDSILWAAGAFCYCVMMDVASFIKGGYWSYLGHIPRYRYLELSGFYDGASEYARSASVSA